MYGYSHKKQKYISMGGVSWIGLFRDRCEREHAEIMCVLQVTSTMLAEKAGIPVEDLVSIEGIEGIDAEVLEDIASFSSETGIDFDNLVAVNNIISQLPEEEFAAFTEELGALIDEGFAQEINDTLNELSEIEGGLENAFNFSSLEECQAAGAQNCEATAAIMDAE